MSEYHMIAYRWEQTISGLRDISYGNDVIEGSLLDWLKDNNHI